MYITARATSPLRWPQVSNEPWLPSGVRTQFELPGYAPLPPPKPPLASVVRSPQLLAQFAYGLLPRSAFHCVSDRYSMWPSVYGAFGLPRLPVALGKPSEFGQVCSRL